MAISTTLISWPDEGPNIDARLEPDGKVYVTLADGEHRLTITLRPDQVETVIDAMAKAAFAPSLAEMVWES